MNSKKKKKAPAAQQLIDSLLDEQTPAPRLERDVTESIQLGSRHDEPHAGKKGESEVTLSVVPGETPSLSKDLNVAMDTTPHFAKAKPASTAKPVAQTTSRNDPSFDQITATGAGSPISGPHSAPNLELQSFPGEDKTMRMEAQAKPKARPALPIPAEDATSPNPPTASRTEIGPHGDPRKHLQQDTSRNVERSAVDRGGITELKTVVKMRDRFQEKPSSQQRPASTGGPGFSSPEASLKQSENLRIAQSRITELEYEIERLRRENEQLATAGETLRRRSDELLSKVETFEISQKELERIHSEEKKVFRGQLQNKDRENLEMRGRLDEMENRLESNFKKIRVRERELEHRLEIVRMESQTLVATKDKMILELKRHIDQITLEGDYAKQKSQEMFNQYKDKQETIRRVVRALRIALTILEGDEDAASVKKAE